MKIPVYLILIDTVANADVILPVIDPLYLL